MGKSGADTCVNSLNCLYFLMKQKSRHAGDSKSSETVAREHEKMIDKVTVGGFLGGLGAHLQYSHPVLGVAGASRLCTKCSRCICIMKTLPGSEGR